MSSENLAIPRLRFPNFSGDWTESRMDSFLVLQRGFDLTKSQSSPGPYPVYSSSGISYYNSEAKVKAPGIVTGRKGSVGPVFFIEEDFWPHDTSLWVKDFKGNIPEFLYHFLVQFGLERYDEASSVPTLNRNNVHRVKVAFPTLPEQRKIADFLTAVDGRIGQLIQKKALLEDYKKGVMQQLFTQAIRFKDDHGNAFPDWEEKKLGAVCRVKKGTQLNKENLEESGLFPAINGGISPSGFTDKFNTDADTITISEGGNSCGFVNFIKTKFWSGGHCYSLEDLDVSIGKEFLFQILKCKERRIMALRVGSGLPNIQKKDINNFAIIRPSFDEQTKIADFLSAIDRKIESVATQITETQTFKRGLLQQMFV